jgi:hypothetical protein
VTTAVASAAGLSVTVAPGKKPEPLMAMATLEDPGAIATAALVATTPPIVTLVMVGIEVTEMAGVAKLNPPVVSVIVKTTVSPVGIVFAVRSNVADVVPVIVTAEFVVSALAAPTATPRGEYTWLDTVPAVPVKPVPVTVIVPRVEPTEMAVGLIEVATGSPLTVRAPAN